MDLLRSTLQPLTHNLPPPLPSALTSLLGPTCYQTLILDLNPTHTPCLTLLVSKSLSLLILLASSIVKIPQLLKLLSSRSSTGLSFPAYALETTAYLITLAYSARKGFPFSTYGETALIAVQDFVIGGLVLGFAGRWAGAAVWGVGVVGAVGVLMGGGVLGERELGWLQVGAGVLGVVSKVPQIWTVWREGGTGQLSAFAVFNYLIGSLTRIFTTMQEVDDQLILYGYLAGFVLNAVLAAQMVYYWNSPATASHAAEIGTRPEKIAMGSGTGTGAAVKGKGPTTRRRG